VGWTTLTKLVGSTIGTAEKNTIPYDWARDGPWYGLFYCFSIFNKFHHIYTTLPPIFQVSLHVQFCVSFVFVMHLSCKTSALFVPGFQRYSVTTILSFVLTVHYYFYSSSIVLRKCSSCVLKIVSICQHYPAWWLVKYLLSYKICINVIDTLCSLGRSYYNIHNVLWKH